MISIALSSVYFAAVKAATPARLSTVMMIPASRTPQITAMTLFLKSILRKLAARVPVHAPVPGWDPNEEQKCYKETLSGLLLKLLTAFFALFQAPGKEFSCDLLILAPFEYPSCEEENKRDRYHISDHAYRKSVVPFDTHTDAEGDSASEFNDRDH